MNYAKAKKMEKKKRMRIRENNKFPINKQTKQLTGNINLTMKSFKIQIIVLTIFLSSFQANCIEVKAPPQSNNITVNEICLNNLSFAIAISGKGSNLERNITLVQIFAEASNPNYPPQPKKCTTKQLSLK